MNQTLAIAGTILTIIAISAYSQQVFAEEDAPGLLVKEQLLSEEFLQTNSFLTFDSVECTVNENGPQASTNPFAVHEGNFISFLNREVSPGLWGQIIRF